MKKIIKRYFRPTPKKWRKLGDICLALAAALTAYSFNNDKWQDWLTLSVIILLIAGKFLTNLTVENEK